MFEKHITNIAIVGAGKVARDHHFPTIGRSKYFRLSAAITLPGEPLVSVPNFRTISLMKKALPEVSAVVLCTPPMTRKALALEALDMGLDIMNEKAPAGTYNEAEELAERAAALRNVFYQAWHSREAAAVKPAVAWLVGKTIKSVVVNWKEDVRIWHPGQNWIWDPGIGVFDTGINAISVLTKILPLPLTLKSADLSYPENKDAPIAADLIYHGSQGEPIALSFDFDQRGPQTWEIEIKTDAGLLKISHGATRMSVDGHQIRVGTKPEYDGVYDRFSELIDSRRSDIDLIPFRYVEDAFAVGRRIAVRPFFESFASPVTQQDCRLSG